MLTTSTEIAALAEALSKAQGAFPAITKGKTAQIKSQSANYSYSYADLADILEAVRKPLAAAGLSIIQPIVDGPEHLELVTRLMHSSGQWIESTYPLASYGKPQETGSAITYARRYALTALLGIAAEEDDDGQAAQSGERKPQAPRAAQQTRPAPMPAPHAPREPGDDTPPSSTPACGHCGSVNVKSDPKVAGWLSCHDCGKGTKVK